jgi:penicillin-binding protein 1B
VQLLLVAAGIVAVAAAGTTYYFYQSFGRMIDERLHGERERTLPRVYARPVDVRRGQSLSQQDLINRLNDLGYAQTPKGAGPGEFALVRNGVAITPRGGSLAGRTVRVGFTTPPAVKRAATAPRPAITVQDLEVVAPPKRAPGKAAVTKAALIKVDRVQLDSPLLTALMTTSAREKRRHVPLSAIPKYVQEAVLSIEDQRFYSHPGVNPIRFVAAAIHNVTGAGQVSGASTITEQLARMFFFEDAFNAEIQSGTRGKSWGSRLRRVDQAFMSLVLERHATKDEILEMYLNDVYLGQRGSFGIHGVAEAARIYFAKDVANLTIAEAAVIAGTINSPITRSPFSSPKRATERRNLVIRAMASEQYITPDQAERASREPLQVVARAVDNEAPYFVDLVSQQLNEGFPGLTTKPGTLDVYTTLDVNMQRAALDAVRNGLARVDAQLATRRRKHAQPPQAALIAVDPRTGDILAMVGGRSYSTSQLNRAVVSRRQPGSVFKPFVYLAAFEQAAADGRTDFTPAAITDDSPATFTLENGQTWEPKNYDEYSGPVTWRDALAHSRNLGTIQVGYQVGFDHVAALWRKVGVGTPPQAYPSIALGVFELTPLEVATAYTLFTNGGSVRPLHTIDRIAAADQELRPKARPLKAVARPDSTFLVTNMLRSVINEGTGAGARTAGFTLDAAGKSGTTNDLRDAWFVGFTPELLTVTWVGFDDNTPLGLTGSAAALPIWTEFMKTVLAGHANRQFEAPEGITFVDIDKDTGKLATPNCPRVMTESFITGTEPTEYCELHRQAPPEPR